MEDDALIFKVLSDPTRLKLMVMLSVCGETCVCGLTEALGVSESMVSRHLGVLRTHGLVKARREGTWIHYSLVPSPPAVLKHLIPYFVSELSIVYDMKPVLERLSTITCDSGRSARE